MNQDIKELKTMKLLRENTGANLHDTGFDNDFLVMTLEAQQQNKKMINCTSS